MSKNDGGSAFPHEEQMDSFTSKIIQCSQGLSIRDYFAAKAMQGMLSNDEMISRYGACAKENNISPDIVLATAAYGISDAMISERAK